MLPNRMCGNIRQHSPLLEDLMLDSIHIAISVIVAFYPFRYCAKSLGLLASAKEYLPARSKPKRPII
jgi:hypothetical protein